jgi:hypothetical protein
MLSQVLLVYLSEGSSLRGLPFNPFQNTCILQEKKTTRWPNSRVRLEGDLKGNQEHLLSRRLSKKIQSLLFPRRVPPVSSGFRMIFYSILWIWSLPHVPTSLATTPCNLRVAREVGTCQDVQVRSTYSRSCAATVTCMFLENQYYIATLLRVVLSTCRDLYARLSGDRILLSLCAMPSLWRKTRPSMMDQI